MTASAPAKTVGIYGGSFNPPHVAHFLVVGWALAQGEVDEVWVMPTGGHPFGKPLAPRADRLEMCRRTFAPYGARAPLCEAEAGPGPHYSIETMRRLAAEHPDYAWRWIMGSDTLEDAAHWREFDALMTLAPPLIVPRLGHAEQRARGSADGFTLPDVSSTTIRERIAAGRWDGLDALVPRAVLDWIRQRGLYLNAH